MGMPVMPDDFENMRRARAIVVALTLNPDATCLAPHVGIRNFQLDGYTAAKEFYSPDYAKAGSAEPDIRSTLFWAPHVQTDAQGKALIQFYNSDQAATLDIHVQGVSTAGNPGGGTIRTSLGQ